MFVHVIFVLETFPRRRPEGTVLVLIHTFEACGNVDLGVTDASRMEDDSNNQNKKK
jgi:hypothetical protein